jgi:hypothetical protein
LHVDGSSSLPILSHQSHSSQYLSSTHHNSINSYSQEVPNRFRKEIVKAVSTKSSSQPSGIISAEGIQSMLANIGAGDQMTRTEIESILREVCGNDATKNVEESCVISAKQMLDLISTQRAA